jgi:hypothetical protein
MVDVNLFIKTLLYGLTTTYVHMYVISCKGKWWADVAHSEKTKAYSFVCSRLIQTKNQTDLNVCRFDVRTHTRQNSCLNDGLRYS